MAALRRNEPTARRVGVPRDHILATNKEGANLVHCPVCDSHVGSPRVCHDIADFCGGRCLADGEGAELPIGILRDRLSAAGSLDYQGGDCGLEGAGQESALSY